MRGRLAEKGYSPEFGARNIARLVQDKIKSFFVDVVLFGALAAGGHAVAEVVDGDVRVRVSEEPPAVGAGGADDPPPAGRNAAGKGQAGKDSARRR